MIDSAKCCDIDGLIEQTTNDWYATQLPLSSPPTLIVAVHFVNIDSNDFTPMAR